MNMKKLFKRRVKETRDWLEVPQWCNPAVLRYFADAASSFVYTMSSHGIAGIRSEIGEITSLICEGIQKKSAVKTLSIFNIMAFVNPEDNAYSQFDFKLKKIKILANETTEYQINYSYQGEDRNGIPFSTSGGFFLEDTFYKILVEKQSDWVKSYYTCTELYADINAWLDGQIPSPRFNDLKNVWDEMQSEKHEIEPFIAANAVGRGKI